MPLEQRRLHARQHLHVRSKQVSQLWTRLWSEHWISGKSFPGWRVWPDLHGDRCGVLHYCLSEAHILALLSSWLLQQLRRSISFSRSNLYCPLLLLLLLFFFFFFDWNTSILLDGYGSSAAAATLGFGTNRLSTAIYREASIFILIIPL